MFKERWKVRDLKVRWFCRNCHQKGIAGITMQPAMVPVENDIKQMIQMCCHTNCNTPDIRIYHEENKN